VRKVEGGCDETIKITLKPFDVLVFDAKIIGE
jgi:hypothetical protein